MFLPDRLLIVNQCFNFLMFALKFLKLKFNLADKVYVENKNGKRQINQGVTNIWSTQKIYR